MKRASIDWLLSPMMPFADESIIPKPSWLFFWIEDVGQQRKYADGSPHYHEGPDESPPNLS